MTARVARPCKILLLVVILIGLLIPYNDSTAAPSHGEAFLPPPPASERPGIFPFTRSKDEEQKIYSVVDPQTQGGPDAFGYTYDAGQTMKWIDAGSQAIQFSQSDDAVYELNLPFAFPFYENVYSSVFVSTNGVISFVEGVIDSIGHELPLDIAPNNLIAVLWDDLVAGNSHVFYKAGSDSQGSYFVIEWRNVIRRGENSPLTFEVVLRPDGTILVQLKDVSGDFSTSTIGIEDSHGLNGLLYLYGSPAPTLSSAILFIPPAEQYRVQFLADYASEFAISGQAWIPVRLYNNGSRGTDAYNLSIVSQSDTGSTAWQVSLYGSDGKTPLRDTNKDHIPDTGPVAEGASVEVWVALSAIDTSQPGDFTQLELRATSTGDPAAVDTIQLVAAVPAGFANAMMDSRLGIAINLIWPYSRTTSKVENWFSGNNFSLVRLPSRNYLYLWEKNGSTPDFSYTNFEYATLTPDAQLRRFRVKLTDNATAGLASGSIRDNIPAIATLSDGKTGVAWIRTLSHFEGNTLVNNYNVYLLFTYPEKDFEFPNINLTGNTRFGRDHSLNIPIYTTPRIAATTDNRFVVAWTEEVVGSKGTVSDVYYQMFSRTGKKLLSSPKKLTNSIPDQLGFGDPVLVPLAGGNVLVGAFGYDVPSQSYQFIYSLVDAQGNQIANSIRTINGVGGRAPTGMQLESGKILIGWTNTDDENLSYILIDPVSLKATSPAPLANPTRRPADSLSITRDANGGAVLTWMDREWYNMLYYSLFDAEGVMVTPPMVFHSGPTNSTIIVANDTGQGAAPYDGDRQNIYLPVISR